MGHLFYGATTEPIAVPDRLLAHLKVVTATKLRRGESFTMSWRHLNGEAGRTTLWLQPSIPLRFVFESADAEQLHAPTLRNMADLANSSAGLVVDLDAQIPEVEEMGRPSAAPLRRSLTTAA